MARAFQPTLKERKRYVVYEPADDRTVLAAYAELFGIRGRARAGIARVDREGARSILRVAHTSVDELKAALVWAQKRSIMTSGTLKKARSALRG